MARKPPGDLPPPPPPSPPDDQPEPPPGRRPVPLSGPGSKGWTEFGAAVTWIQRVGATLVDALVLVVPSSLADLAGTRAVGRTVGGVLAVAVQALYLILLIQRSGRTVGNRAVTTAVVAEQDGGPPDLARAVRRWLLPGGLTLLLVVLPVLFLPTAAVYLADVLWPLWDRRNQTLHDKLAGTLVIRTA